MVSVLLATAAVGQDNASTAGNVVRATISDVGRVASELSSNASQWGAPVASEYGWGAYFQAIGVVFLILAVLAGGFYLLKRVGPRAGLGRLSQSTLRLEGQLSIGPKKSVVVVRFLNKRLVLGVTDTTINLLTTETDYEQDDFKGELEEARKRGDPS